MDIPRNAARGARTITLNAHPFHFQELGQGDPLILIHGGGPGASGWSNYERNAEELSEQFRLLIVDLPGFGESSAVSLGKGVFRTYADAIRNFMEQIQLDRASFIGNSLGGGTALRFALDYPERVDRLVLMGTAGGRSLTGPWPSEGLGHLFGYYRGDGPSRQKLRAFLRAMIHDPAAISNEILEERFRASTRADILANPPFGTDPLPPIEELWREDLSCIDHRVLLIWGREDRTIPLDSAFPFLAQLRNAELHVFSRCGHWVQWERPRAFNWLVAQFLRRP